MSTSGPKLNPCQHDLLKGVGDWTEDGSNTPLAYQWADHVGKTLGFHRIQELPLYWDGQGCVILQREAKPTTCPESHPAREFRYLALVNLAYDDEIVVGICGVAALLQFYALVQPWLALAGDPSFRFNVRGDKSGMWNGGASWKDVSAARRKGSPRKQRRD